MRNYRHTLHAGNPADVLKHVALVEILGYLREKEKPFDYIDTHAGAGIYQLGAPRGGQSQESESGIGRLLGAGEPELQPYLAIIRHFNSDGRLRRYPGSPKIAAQLLREQDQAWLLETDPDEFPKLRQAFQGNAQFHLAQEDGYEGLARLLPPVSRRACTLIDPPYEANHDYARVVEQLIKAHKRFATGTYVLWYPVIERWRIERMEHGLIKSGLRRIQRFELQHAISHNAGMWASGLFVINPPWMLMRRMQSLLPILAERLGEDGAFGFRCDELVGE
ncbi:MAG: 23S rRNA (adenine(2030)-N(6))-methyltransferase RlmJ [Candidatus Thiodiazotropha sp.]|jgi:23S rRNA (adenine2030-N6)-methyltransferase